jgi:hypothetical protein
MPKYTLETDKELKDVIEEALTWEYNKAMVRGTGRPHLHQVAQIIADLFQVSSSKPSPKEHKNK